MMSVEDVGITWCVKSLKYLFCAIVLMLSGCAAKQEDPRLLEIAEKVSDSPEEMLERLDSMNIGSMKESDRWFHALMRIKAQDKAYVRHTSDSIILKVMDYYSHHKGSGHYPEALYYGGRIYRDLGDAPTALRYFQDALDALPEEVDNDLRYRIFNQMGALFNSLRLYREASTCIQETIRLISYKCADGDSINLMREIQLLGAINMHAEDYEKADSCFLAARNIGSRILHKDTIIQEMYLAGNELYRGNVKDALKKIRNVLESVPKERRDIIYSYGSQIYLAAGISDTAYYFALKLIRSDNNDYRKIGYSTLLRPELRVYSEPDSLLSYSLAYRDVLDEYLDRHDAQQVSLQISFYNYQTHERGRKRAEEAKNIYMYAAGGAMFFVLLLCIVIMYLRNRSMKTLLKYRKALDDIALLKKTLSEETEIYIEKETKTQERRLVEELQSEQLVIIQSECEDEVSMSDKVSRSKEEKEKDILRECLKEELLALQKAGEAKKEVAESILSSSAYGGLQEYLSEGKRIPDSDSLWGELEDEVLKVSPKFKSGLYLLAGDKLKEDAYHMALLIKCGITPTELTILVGRSKGAVSSRRGYICEMIFGQKLGAKVMDDIIRLL